MISPRAHLAAAVRRLNAEYRRLPDPGTVPVFADDLLDLEHRVQQAMQANDDLAALQAIDRWRDAHLANFTRHRQTTGSRS